jgi:polyketide biosynthesis acyl carrier protein
MNSESLNMNSAAIFQLILLNIEQIVPHLNTGNIDRDAMCAELGLDSIGRAELIEITLEELGLQAPRPEFHAAHNLGELSDLFARKLKEKNLKQASKQKLGESGACNL